MPLWRRLLRLALLVVVLGGAVTAVLFIELADLASTNPVSYRNANSHREHNRNKQEWSAQISAATDWLSDKRDWLNVIFTGLVALFTLTLSISTSRLSQLAATQSLDMQELLTAARDNAVAAANQAEAMRQLHLAAQVQANHADRAIESAEKIARLQLRAYITVEPGGIVKWEETGEPSGSIFARNFGKTPAYEVEIALKVIATKEPPDTDISDDAPIVIAGDMMIAAGAHQNAAVYPFGPLEEIQFADVFDRKKFFVVTGFVKYRDAFGKDQRTRFCHLYQGPDLGKQFVRYNRVGNSAT